MAVITRFSENKHVLLPFGNTSVLSSVFAIVLIKSYNPAKKKLFSGNKSTDLD
jgi:hypothetical protein